MPSPNRTVLITGACGDIGRAIASVFAERDGARLALCDLLPPDQAAPILDPLRQRAASVFYRPVDVTDADAVHAFTQSAAAELGPIDVCIANAGIVERGPLADQSPASWCKQLDVNLTGSFLTAQAAARVMRPARSGHILFLGSWVQDVPRENIASYCVSKAGIKMLAQCLALELAPDNIRVNVVAPGWVDAGLTGQNLRDNPARRPEIESAIPLRRLIPADELARAVHLFCSPDAAYMTGATFLLDGGGSLFPNPPKPNV